MSRVFSLQSAVCYSISMIVALLLLLSANNVFGGVGDHLLELRLLGVLSLGNLVYAGYLSFRTGKSTIPIFFLWVVIFCIYHFGQLWLLLAGESSLRLLNYTSIEISAYQIVMSCGFALLSMNVLLGVWYNQVSSRRIGPLQNIPDLRALLLSNRFWSRIAPIIMIIVTCARVYCDSLRYVAFSSGGYLQIYKVEMSGTIIPLLDTSFASALAFYYYTIVGRRYLSRIVLFLGLSYYVITMVVIGSRGDQVIGIILLAWVYNIFSRKAVKSKIAHLVIAAVLIGITLPIFAWISMTRLESTNLKDKVILVQSGGDGSILADGLAEMGGTITNTVFVREYLIPERGYQLGRTYIYSFLVRVPFLSKVFPVIAEQYSVGEITNKYGLPLGGSCVAESYANFGWFGIANMIWVGVALARIAIGENAKLHCSKRVFQDLIVLQAILVYIRGDFYIIALAIIKCLLLEWLHRSKAKV